MYTHIHTTILIGGTARKHLAKASILVTALSITDKLEMQNLTVLKQICSSCEALVSLLV